MTVRTGRPKREFSAENEARARRLVELREAAGMTQEEVGRQIGTYRDMVSRWERNVNTPGMENIIRLAKLFGVDAHWLMTGTSHTDADGPDVSQALTVFLDDTASLPEPPTEDEIACLSEIKMPRGRAPTSSFYSEIWRALRWHTEPSQSRPSTQAGGPEHRKDRSRKSG